MTLITSSLAEKYDEKSARQHIRRVKDILSNPPVLTAQTDAGLHEPQAPEAEEKPAQKEEDVKKEDGEKKQEVSTG